MASLIHGAVLKYLVVCRRLLHHKTEICYS